MRREGKIDIYLQPLSTCCVGTSVSRVQSSLGASQVIQYTKLSWVNVGLDPLNGWWCWGIFPLKYSLFKSRKKPIFQNQLSRQILPWAIKSSILNNPKLRSVIFQPYLNGMRLEKKMGQTNLNWYKKYFNNLIKHNFSFYQQSRCFMKLLPSTQKFVIFKLKWKLK